MQTRPTIVLYLDHTARLSGGEIALARLLEAVDRTRVKPIALLAEDGPLAARLRALDVETHVLPLSGKVRDVRKDSLGLGAALRHAQKIPYVSTYAARVARFARQHQADIIHTNSLKSDLYGAIAGRLARVPVVWHVRDRIEPTYLPRPAVRLFRLLARRLPAYVVANSQSTLETLYLGGARPCAVVPSGIDRSEIGAGDEPATPDSSSGSKPARIGIVGRIARWKGQHIFLEAAARVTELGHDARFVIVGTPLFGEESYEEEIRRQAADSGIESRVEFLGFRKDVPQVLRSLDVLVHASTSPEPFGQVVVEGMAAGLPVIGTDGGGVREIITHEKTGLLVPMANAPALTRALDELLRDPEKARRLGFAGQAHVRQNYTSEQSARKIEKVYEEVLAMR